jgi:hypothetical protein
MDTIFKPHQTRNTVLWGVVLIAVIDVPFVAFLLLSQGPALFYLLMGGLLVVIDGLILPFALFGKRMRYALDDDAVTIHFGLSRRRIPYTTIQNVRLSPTSLQLRLFGASWPGLHWGLYTAKDVGRVWVYATMMRGDFVLLSLVDGKTIALSPEDPQAFLSSVTAQHHRFDTTILGDMAAREPSQTVVYAQVLAVLAAFFVFFGYLLWIYPSLPEVIPVHFDFSWTPNRWGHKSELFIIAGIAAIFPIINTVLTLKFGRHAKELVLPLGVVFVFMMALFFSLVYITQSFV